MDLKDEEPPYKFDYYLGSSAPYDFVPPPYYYMKDIWGYYNGNNSTTYENNINRIELMSSASVNTFCTIQSVNTESNSQTVKAYSFKDEDIKGSTMYYMLRFQDNYGNWTYSNYYTVKIN